MIDSSIPLNPNAPRPTPFAKTLGQMVSLRGGQLENQQRQQQIVQNDVVMAQQRQAGDEQAAADDRLRALFASANGQMPPPEAIVAAVGWERGSKIVTGIGALQAAKRKDYDDKAKVLRDAFAGYASLPEDMRSKAHGAARAALVDGGVVPASEIPEQYDPAWFQRTISYGQQPEKPITMSPGQRLATPQGRELYAVPPNPVSVAPGGSLVRPDTGQATYTAPQRTPASIDAALLEADRRGDQAEVGRLLALKRRGAQAGHVESTPTPRPAQLSEAQRAVAARTKGRDLYTAERDFRRDLDSQQIPRTGKRTPEEQAGYDEAVQILNERKLDIENTYRAQHGLEPLPQLGPEWNAGPPRPAAVQPPSRAAAPAGAPPATAPRGGQQFTDPAMRKKAREALNANGFDASDAAIDTFLSKPQNRAKLGYR
jgi:hypothetical protein